MSNNQNNQNNTNYAYENLKFNITSEQQSDKIVQLSFKIKDFCYNTIIGFESGIYKTHKYLVKKLEIKSIALGFIASYHNGSYKSLILDNDPYIVEKYGEMHTISTHSYICLLNITMLICKTIIQKMIREFLDDSSYDNYMQMVKLQIKMILNTIELEKMLCHNCTGEDIKKCNPNEDMFNIVTQSK